MTWCYAPRSVLFLYILGIMPLTLCGGTNSPMPSVRADSVDAPAAHLLCLRHSEMCCGPACLSFLSELRGATVPMTSIPTPPCPRPFGWSVKDLETAAKLMGLSATARIYDWLSLCRYVRRERVAGILHVNGHHFVLLYMHPTETLRIFDPADRSISTVRHVHRHYDWQGVVLLVNQPGSGIRMR